MDAGKISKRFIQLSGILPTHRSGYALIIVLLAVVIIIGIYLLGSTSIFEPHEQKKVLDENQRLIAKINRTIANGEDINAEQNRFKATLLHIAAKIGNIEGTKLLLANGAEIERGDHLGNTPLHTAIIENNLEIAKLLIHATRNIDCKNNSGMTPLHMAALYGRTEFIEMLIQNGSKVNSKTNFGTTPLRFVMIQIETGSFIETYKTTIERQRNVARLLKEYGATE